MNRSGKAINTVINNQRLLSYKTEIYDYFDTTEHTHVEPPINQLQIS